MATPAKANFTLKANGYWERIWQINNDGVPADITGYTFELEVKQVKGPGVSSRFLNLTVGNGIEIVDAEEGKIKITIPPQTTVTVKKTYYYDFIAIKDSHPVVWLEGTMTFDPGVSYSGT